MIKKKSTSLPAVHLLGTFLSPVNNLGPAKDIQN
jgi:hypothetical protein